MKFTATDFFRSPDYNADPEAEAAFFDPLKMPNGTFKRTQPMRFSEIENRFRSVFSERIDETTDVLDHRDLRSSG